MRYKGITTDTKPWYKHFWPWFIIGIIVWTFMSGAGMLYFANQNPYSMVDGFDKIGKAITENDKLRQKAKDLGVKAIIFKDKQDLKLLISPIEHARDFSNLSLRIIHPTDDKKDKVLKIKMINGHLLSEMPKIHTNRSKIILRNRFAGWEISGSLNGSFKNETTLE